MHNILRDILENKKIMVVNQKKEMSSEELANRTIGLRKMSMFKQKILSAKKIAVIAEVKVASPTITDLGDKETIVVRAIAYENGNADAISYITEETYFKGEGLTLMQIKKSVKLPVLQKDFVIDPYQIFQAKYYGSDAILLIGRYLKKDTLQRFVAIAQGINIEPIVEVNTHEDLEKALGTTTECIAVNARNLETFEVSIPTACSLMQAIPNTFVKLGFSGIQSSLESKQYKEAGARGILVGTALMRTQDIAHFIADVKNV